MTFKVRRHNEHAFHFTLKRLCAVPEDDLQTCIFNKFAFENTGLSFINRKWGQTGGRYDMVWAKNKVNVSEWASTEVFCRNQFVWTPNNTCLWLDRFHILLQLKTHQQKKPKADLTNLPCKSHLILCNRDIKSIIAYMNSNSIKGACHIWNFVFSPEIKLDQR